jgi:hypothetical protein
LADGQSFDPVTVARSTTASSDATDERLPPLELPHVQFRWTGLLAVVGFMGIIAVVAQTLGPEVAAAVTAVALSALVGAALRARRRRSYDATMDATGDALVWHEGADGYVDCDFGGDCGGGGGDC